MDVYGTALFGLFLLNYLESFHGVNSKHMIWSFFVDFTWFN